MTFQNLSPKATRPDTHYVTVETETFWTRKVISQPLDRLLSRSPSQCNQYREEIWGRDYCYSNYGALLVEALLTKVIISRMCASSSLGTKVYPSPTWAPLTIHSAPSPFPTFFFQGRKLIMRMQSQREKQKNTGLSNLIRWSTGGATKYSLHFLSLILTVGAANLVGRNNLL